MTVDPDDVGETADQSVATSKETAATVNGALEETSTDTTKSDTHSETTDTVGPGEASSPMDFFLNCQQYHVNQSLSTNRARTVEIVRRRAELPFHDHESIHPRPAGDAPCSSNS